MAYIIFRTPLKAELPELALDVPGVVSAPVYEGVDTITDSGALLKIGFDVKGSKQLSANREMNSRVRQLLERCGVAVPGDPAGDPPKEA